VPKIYLKWATVAIAATALLLTAYTYFKFRVAPGITFSELQVIDASGKSVKLGPGLGRPTVIVFYASWCHDCARELPKLDQALRGPLAGAEVIALTDEDLATMLKYRDAASYKFRFYVLPKDFESYGIHAIPTFYVMNSQGKAVFSKVGDVDWNSSDILRKFE